MSNLQATDPAKAPASGPEPLPARKATRLPPILTLSAALLGCWTVWAVLLHPLVSSTPIGEKPATHVAAQVLFWGGPCSLYLYQVWGSRSLEPLGFHFPLGQTQVFRAFLLAVVVGAIFVSGTAAQLQLTIGEIGEQLLDHFPADFLTPLIEETVFRGVVLAELLNWTHTSAESTGHLRTKFWSSQVFVACLFTAVHFPSWLATHDLGQALQMSGPLLATGMILGFVYANSRSLWPCIFLHWLNNQLSLLY